MIDSFDNLKKIFIAIVSGVIPAILWLWFWLKNEDSEEPEPLGLIVLSFLTGAFLVFIAIGIEKYSLNFINDKNTQIIAWAAIEEIIKLLGVTLIIWGNKNVNQPIDYPMYFIAVALGFAGMENFLYIINPIEVSGTVVGMITGNLRFLGSTLLHAISSAMIGSALGLSFYIKKYRTIYFLIGLSLAIILHSIFNFFIMKGGGENFLSVFGFLWVVTIINILIFEKLKRMVRHEPAIIK